MKRLFLCLALVVFLISGCRSKPKENAYASVGEAIITTEQYEKALDFYKKYYAVAPSTDFSDIRDEEELEEAVRDLLVLQEVMQLDLLKHGIAVTDQDVERAMSRDIAELGGQKEFEAMLSSYGVDEEAYRNFLYTYVVAQAHREFYRLNAPRTRTLQDEEAYYVANVSRLETRSLRQIVVATKPEAGRVYDALKDGMPFDEAVRTYTLDQETKDTVGAIGDRRREDFDAEVAKQLFLLDVGSFSKPMEIDGRWYIFEVESKRVDFVQLQEETKTAMEEEYKNALSKQLQELKVNFYK